MTIPYRKADSGSRWKYILKENFSQHLDLYVFINTRKIIDHPYLATSLNLAGMTLDIARGYAWDGLSGPTIDTGNTLRASLVHDALYQLIRLGAVEPPARKTVDQIFLEHLKEDGVNFIRRRRFYIAVRCFGARFAKPS